MGFLKFLFGGGSSKSKSTSTTSSNNTKVSSSVAKTHYPLSWETFQAHVRYFESLSLDELQTLFHEEYYSSSYRDSKNYPKNVFYVIAMYGTKILSYITAIRGRFTERQAYVYWLFYKYEDFTRTAKWMDEPNYLPTSRNLEKLERDVQEKIDEKYPGESDRIWYYLAEACAVIAAAESPLTREEIDSFWCIAEYHRFTLYKRDENNR